MKVEIWPIENLIPYARNRATSRKVLVNRVAASVREFGFRQPIVVDQKGVIIVGHVRLLAAQQLELTEVPVHVATEFTPAQVNGSMTPKICSSGCCGLSRSPLIRV
jgi:ParB-like chromosome segregation protein Spo0J